MFSLNLPGLFQVWLHGEGRRSQVWLSAQNDVSQTEISGSTAGKWTSWLSFWWFSYSGEAVGPVQLARLRLMSGHERFEKLYFTKSKYNPRWRLTPSLLGRSEIVLASLCRTGANVFQPVWLLLTFQTQYNNSFTEYLWSSSRDITEHCHALDKYRKWGRGGLVSRNYFLQKYLTRLNVRLIN